MAGLFKELAAEHGLDQEETRHLLESIISDTLSCATQQKFLAAFDGKRLQIYKGEGRSGYEGLVEIPPEKVRKEIVRLFRYRLDAELKRRKAFAEHEYLKTLRGKVLKGTIDRILENGCLSVLFYIEELFSCREWLGICPVANQPCRERGTYRKGQGLYFFISSVRLVQEGRLYRHVITLSRSTPQLTEALLIRQTGHNGVKCVRRIAGKISVVNSETRLPRESIIAVGKELRERIKVRCLTC